MKSATRLISVVSAMIMVTGAIAPAAFSQNKQPAKPLVNLPWGKKPNENPNNGNMVQLKEAVSLENLPDFTGHKKFVYGTVREWELGQAWSEYFMIKEKQADVLSWYSQVLQAQQWKIVATNECQIMAKHKDGNTCQIGVQAVRNNPAAQASLSIAYFVPKKTR